MPKLSKISFSFVADKVNPALLRDRIATVCIELCKHFGLTPDAVNIAHKKRLPDDAPFVLNCYGQNGKPDYVAMASAARIVLPGIEDLVETSEHFRSRVTGWSAGKDLGKDIGALWLVARGYHRTQDGVDDLPLDKREWLERTAQSCGALVNSVDNFSNEELAHIVHAELSAQLAALGCEASAAPTFGHLPFVVKKVARNAGTLEVTGSLLLNTHKSSDSALGQYGGKVA